MKKLVCTLLCLPLSAFAGSADRETLRKSVEVLLSQPPLAGAHVSVEVESIDDGQVIFAKNADDQLNPASNTKLITAAAALLRLGPEYRFTTDVLANAPLAHGKAQTLYVKGRGDPAVNTERLEGIVSDLWHRGLRSVGDVVLDDSFFDREEFGPGWEQETSDKSWAAGVDALSLNHNSVGIYIIPGDRAGQKARIEVDPDARDYFIIESRVSTVRANGRRKLRPRTIMEGEKTRVIVEGRIALKDPAVIMFRRVGDPALYYGQTLRALLERRGIRVTGKVQRGLVPQDASLLQTYDSPELAEIVRDMNKVSSNFIAEMLVKTLGAELKGTPGTWPKGLEVVSDLLADLGIPRGTYTLRNGSGLNDTNRFSAKQVATLLQGVWKRFPVAAEFVSSLGIAARDGTMRLRMEGSDAAGRLRAKTGTLEHVTALSGYVQSLGGERFAFSILVNDWAAAKSSVVVSSIDRLGILLASAGAPEAAAREAAIASAAQFLPQDAPPAELKARLATYTQLAAAADKKNLPVLRSALRSERDPLLRVALADALYRSDPDQGGGPLLEALPPSPDLLLHLRSVARDLSLPAPAIASLFDLAVDGNPEALARLLALAPAAQADAQLASALTDGLVEVGEASPDEMLAALRLAPAPQPEAALSLVAAGLAKEPSDVAHYPLVAAMQTATDASGWLALLLPHAAPAVASSSPVPAPASPLSSPALITSISAAAPASFPASGAQSPPPGTAAAVPAGASGTLAAPKAASGSSATPAVPASTAAAPASLPVASNAALIATPVVAGATRAAPALPVAAAGLAPSTAAPAAAPAEPAKPAAAKPRDAGPSHAGGG